jgi:hypothetical protein
VNGPPKPAWGAPCNGCGVCCSAETCPIALAVVPRTEEDAVCPALEWDGGRAWCGLIRNPGVYANPVGVAALGVLYGIKPGGFAAWMLEAIGGGECDADGDHGLTAFEWLGRYRPEAAE